MYDGLQKIAMQLAKNAAAMTVGAATAGPLTADDVLARVDDSGVTVELLGSASDKQVATLLEPLKLGHRLLVQAALVEAHGDRDWAF